MSKYSKMLSMKNGSNMKIQKASVGMFAIELYAGRLSHVLNGCC